jgi:hypothetical protein
VNRRGKSDSPIVPGKLPNKGSGAPRPTEEVEERGLAKGNTLRQTRSRIQSRTGLQHALERIRQAATPVRYYPRCSSARWDLCGGVPGNRHSYRENNFQNSQISGSTISIFNSNHPYSSIVSFSYLNLHLTVSADMSMNPV